MMGSRKLNKMAGELESPEKFNLTEAPDKAVEVICTYAPLLRKVISIVKIFTGKKVDAILDKIIEALDILCPRADDSK